MHLKVHWKFCLNPVCAIDSGQFSTIFSPCLLRIPKRASFEAMGAMHLPSTPCKMLCRLQRVQNVHLPRLVLNRPECFHQFSALQVLQDLCELWLGKPSLWLHFLCPDPYTERVKTIRVWHRQHVWHYLQTAWMSSNLSNFGVLESNRNFNQSDTNSLSHSGNRIFSFLCQKKKTWMLKSHF